MTNSNALSLASASSQAVSITDAAALKPTGHWTVEGWFKISGTSQTIFQSSNNGTNVTGIRVDIDGTGKVRAITGKNTGTTSGTDWKDLLSASAANDGNFHHFACVWDGSTLYVYVNGFLSNSTSWTNAPAYDATNYVRIGVTVNGGTSSQYVNGQLDEIRFWSTARTQAEIQANMFRDVTGDTNLIDSWKLNNDYASSSGTHDGTAIGSPTFTTTVPFPTYTSVSSVALVNSTLFSDANLVSYWPYEGNSNDYKDSNNGTDTSVTYSTGNGKFLQGAGFNGTSSIISLGNPTNLKITSNFTLCGWIATSANPSEQDIIQSESENTNVAGIKLFVSNGGRLQFLIGRNTGTTANTDYKILQSASAINNGSYNFFAITWDGSSMYIYVNGILDAVVSWSNAPGYATTSYARIGGGNTTGTDTHFWNGNQDDTAIFNRALSATEVFNLYTGLSAISGGTLLAMEI